MNQNDKSYRDELATQKFAAFLPKARTTSVAEDMRKAHKRIMTERGAKALLEASDTELMNRMLEAPDLYPGAMLQMADDLAQVIEHHEAAAEVLKSINARVFVVLSRYDRHLEKGGAA